MKSLAERVAAKYVSAWDEDQSDEGESDDDDADLFSREDMHEGYTIQDARGTGYDVYQAGKHVGHFKEWEQAIHGVNRHMEQHKFYPNVYYVNERGNTDLLDAKGNTLKSRV